MQMVHWIELVDVAYAVNLRRNLATTIIKYVLYDENLCMQPTRLIAKIFQWLLYSIYIYAVLYLLS